jgi:hypothetical protein
VRNIVTVTTAPTATKLTTLARVKSELSITDSANDPLLNAKIDEASSDAEASLGFTVPRATVAETYWHSEPIESLEYLVLDRAPVVSIDSIVVDDATEPLDPSLYRCDPEIGLVYALNGSGFPWRWLFYKSLVVNYTGGYLLPGQTNRNLPVGIEGAVVDMVQSFWLARGRDPLLKRVDLPGVINREWWVGTVGEAGELPPGIVIKLAPFRRALV